MCNPWFQFCYNKIKKPWTSITTVLHYTFGNRFLRLPTWSPLLTTGCPISHILTALSIHLTEQNHRYSNIRDAIKHGTVQNRNILILSQLWPLQKLRLPVSSHITSSTSTAHSFPAYDVETNTVELATEKSEGFTSQSHKNGIAIQLHWFHQCVCYLTILFSHGKELNLTIVQHKCIPLHTIKEHYTFFEGRKTHPLFTAVHCILWKFTSSPSFRKFVRSTIFHFLSSDSTCPHQNRTTDFIR